MKKQSEEAYQYEWQRRAELRRLRSEERAAAREVEITEAMERWSVGLPVVVRGGAGRYIRTQWVMRVTRQRVILQDGSEFALLSGHAWGQGTRWYYDWIEPLTAENQAAVERDVAYRIAKAKRDGLVKRLSTLMCAVQAARAVDVLEKAVAALEAIAAEARAARRERAKLDAAAVAFDGYTRQE